MFRRYKKDEGAPNKLIDQSEPNKLTWTSGDGAPIDPDVAAFLGEEPDDEPGQENAEDELDTRTPAERAADLDAELQREAEEFGLTGSNPTEMYGPNGEDVAALLDSLADIDDQTAESIADAYEAIPAAERKVAQSVVRRRYRGARESELWAAEHAVSDWLAAMQLEGDDLALYSIVADAATDAVDALVLEDELADVDFNTLYDAWSEVMDSEEEDGDPEESGAEAAEPAKGSGSKKTEAVEKNAADEAEEDGEFGPNTELVLRFLTKLAGLSAAETTELVTAWRRQPKEELSISHRHLQALADEDHKWREQLRLAQEEVFAWMNGRSEKRDYAFGTANSLARVREIAGPADAVAALAMADILEAEDAETLYAPWAEAIGEPALPSYEDDESDGDED
jgi:hypothetical protein